MLTEFKIFFALKSTLEFLFVFFLLFFYLQNLQYEREWEKRQYVKLYGYAGTIKRFCNYTPEKFEEYLVQLDKIEHDYDKEVLRPFHAAFEFAEWNSTYLYERRVNYWKDLKNEFTEEELASWGVNVVIYANHMLRSAYPAMVNTAKSILTHHRSLEVNDMCMSVKEILELIPGTK